MGQMTPLNLLNLFQVFFYTDVKFQASQSGNQSFSVLTTQLPVMISSVESKLGVLCGVVSVAVGVGIMM